jgi:selenide, water dikinase
LVGLSTFDDAGVFRLTDDLALIQTIDFFTPIVDDPYAFGQIAAANALSDIYAMGGEPLTAMNMICFPIKTMEITILREILKGGLDKLKESGTILVGGHSIEDDELKYGLSVTGKVHPRKVLTNKGGRPGDLLVLTKPLGTGILNTAMKGNLVDRDTVEEVTRLMAALNKTAAEEIKRFPVSACTDVTGFGLLGHACEMIEGETVGLRIFARKAPLLKRVLEFAQMGMVPAGTQRNRVFRENCLAETKGIDPVLLDVLFDPQTSGGLLVAVPKDHADGLLEALMKRGLDAASVIGEFVSSPPGKILIEA